MDKKTSFSREAESELTAFRQQIDDIDDKIIKLLLQRTEAVSRIGELKRKETPGLCPIRPGREADMIRRIVHKFHGTPFLPEAAAAMWRILIGMSTSVEGALRLSVYTPERNDELFWMAREYFGTFVPVTRQPHVKRVIGDVMDGKASVGIVPLLRGDDTSYWWTNLLQQGNNTPKIFAQIPFVRPGTPDKNAPAAFAIARLMPEASSDDVSLLVLEADHNVSQNRLQTAFSQIKLQASWINIATLSPSTRHHLLEIKGFVTPNHPEIKNLVSALGNSIINVSFLGAYGVPVTLPATDKTAASHVAPAPKA